METKIRKHCWALQGSGIRNWRIGSQLTPLCFPAYLVFSATAVYIFLVLASLTQMLLPWPQSQVFSFSGLNSQ